MSKIAEIKKAYKILKNEGKNEVSLLHCISSYPTKKRFTFKLYKFFKKSFIAIGHSDHTNDILFHFVR